MGSAFKINGLDGKRVLKGTIPISGAKNAALKILPAALLFEDTLTVENIPHIEDIDRTLELMDDLGFEIEKRSESAYRVSSYAGDKTELSKEIASKIRASIVFSGPLLSRFGSVSFYLPGGCLIGKRPIDIFLEGYRKMGAELKITELANSVRFSLRGKLRGAELFLKTPSVTATEAFMLAGVLAEGATVIKNAAMEPEIPSLASFLNSCGARIEGAGTPTIAVRGGRMLKCGRKVYRAIPDRVEAGSFIVLAALAARDLTISDCDPSHLESLLSILESSGVQFEIGRDFVRVTSSSQQKPYESFDIKTQGYPGFPTDLQAIITLFLTQAEGTGSVFETIFESRLEYVHDLQRMGAIIHGGSNEVVVRGPTALHGQEMRSLDIRSGMAFVLAGIIAKGQSIIHNAYNIDRGYEKIEERLRAVGVDIERVPECAQ
jgi:UDP-N-acetylglucosamine 1-carboxyvinyltransferase